MKLRSIVPMRTAKIGYIVVSVCFLLAGIWMLCRPDAALEALDTFFGVALTVFGAVKLIGYFSRDLYRLAFQYDLEFGLLLVILGIVILFQPGLTMNLFCIASGICLILAALFKWRTAVEARAFGLETWWMTAALSVLSVAAGVLLIVRSGDAARALVLLMGAALIADAALNLCVALTMVKIVKNQLLDPEERRERRFERT